MAGATDFWVFGYGSLLWDPGFEPVETSPARLLDYHRSFCMLSIHHRGTQAQPGLVLALDRMAQASCAGMAFRVAPGDADRVLSYLRERELVSAAYLERVVPLAFDDGRVVDALTYVIDREHRQYVRYDLERQAQTIASARGGRGANRDYLLRTVDSLGEMGIEDDELTWLAQRVAALTGGSRQ